MPYVISFYIAKKFSMNLLMTLLLVSLIVFLFDVMETFKISYNHDVTIFFIMKMAMLTNYNHINVALPFIVLLATMATYMQLTKCMELIIIKVSGLSVWKFALPAVLTSFIFGVLVVAIVNPIGTLMSKKYSYLKKEVFNIRTQEVKLFENGLWLRHEESEGQVRYIIHASKISQQKQELFEVMVVVTDLEGKMIKRLDAKKAYINDGVLLLKQVNILDREYNESKESLIKIKASITLKQIQESISPPHNVSVWELPSFIEELYNSGFSILSYQSHFYKLMFLPIFFVAMVLIGVPFSTLLPRMGKSNIRLFLGVVTGFVVYFLFDVITALGASGNMPIAASVIIPITICLVYGVYLILHYEY